MKQILKFSAHVIISVVALLLVLNTNNAFATHSVTNYSWWPTVSVPVDVSEWPSEWINSLTDAMNAWNNAGSNFRFIAGNTGNKFYTSYWTWPYPLAYAVTYTTPIEGTYQIIHAETAFNSWYSWSTSGDPCCIDVQNVATHELGHWLRLADLYGSNDTQLTMYGWPTSGDIYGETNKRTLESDDIDAIRHTYPLPTYISGPISQNTTWYQNRVYVIQGQVTVDPGVTLTIEPGAIVKFQDNWSSLEVNGTLSAQGASQNKIYFTSIYDDSVGGDTNGDGSASSPGAGDWQTLQFNSGSTGDISNTVIRYAGNYYGYGVYNNGGTLTLSHTKIEKNSNPWDGIGLTQTEGVLTINDSEFNEQRLGLSIQGGSAAISQSKFQNQNWGLVASGSTALTLTNNTFNNNSIAAALINGSVNFTHSGNFVPDTSTGLKGFAMTGWISQDRRWTSGDLPYIIRDNDNVTVDYGSTLTIQPGAVVKFGNSYAPLSINGILSAQGTPTSTISFTSLKDDLIGGDTNSDGYSSGSPNDWDAISFWSGSQGNFSNSIIRYGGAYNNGAISTNYDGGTINISDSQIDHNGTYGIYHANGSLSVTGTEIHDHSYGLYFAGGTIPALSQNHLYNNSAYGLYNATTNIITAENNYWSSPSGPYHPTLNPQGTGNPVSDYVDFDPWLTQWP